MLKEAIKPPYHQVSDPDDDPLDINVYSNLLEHGLKLIKESGNSGRIEWTANVSGAHSIYLTATDPSGNSAEVMFNLAEIEDLNLFTIFLEVNSSEAGQVYGNGLYNPGEYVTVEVVPGELYNLLAGQRMMKWSALPRFIPLRQPKTGSWWPTLRKQRFSIIILTITRLLLPVLPMRFYRILVPNKIEGCSVTGIGILRFISRESKA